MSLVCCVEEVATMNPHSRFDCPSALLGLTVLLKRGRYMLWSGLALAVALHLGLSWLPGLREEKAASRPLTTQFVKR